MNVRPLDEKGSSTIFGDIFFTASFETPDEVAMSSAFVSAKHKCRFSANKNTCVSASLISH